MVAGPRGGSRVRARVRERDGRQPFLLSRLAAGLRDQGVPFTAALPRVRGRIEAVRDAVGATLARLDSAAVALAEAVAVLATTPSRRSQRSWPVSTGRTRPPTSWRGSACSKMRDRCASSTPSSATRSPRGCRPVYATYSTLAPPSSSRQSTPAPMPSPFTCWPPSPVAGAGSSISSPPRRASPSPGARPKRQSRARTRACRASGRRAPRGARARSCPRREPAGRRPAVERFQRAHELATDPVPARRPSSS